MKIFIKTRIEKNYQIIFSKFNIDLFKALKPPLINLEVERFDGCKSGDEVHLKMSLFGIINQRWISHITKDVKSNYDIYFIDEGALIPPPLKKWTHYHRIEKISELASFVIDDIDYTTGSSILDLILYPVFYSIFYYRKPIYKRELS